MEGSSPNDNLKTSLKATTLFGGVQVFNIFTSILKNKLVALIIGPIGIGLVELYSSTVRLIKSFTDFSIHVSAVREISIAYKSGNTGFFSHSVSVFSKVVWMTGLLGTAVCLLGSPLWSKLTFGDYSHTLAFVFLSLVLLFQQLQSGKTVLLQSTGQYKYMALSGVIGSLLGLVTTVPIYYFVGVDGIVAVLIITAASGYLISAFFASKVDVKIQPVSFKTAFFEGKKILGQGFLISINYLLSALIFYILRIFITDKGGALELGLYSASFAIVNNYIGLVFQSVSKEYCPRISALSNQSSKFSSAVNDQIYLILLILGPLIAVFLTFSDQLLSLLYSNKFTDASLLMAFCMAGIVFQTPSWCMSYAFLAKGDNKTFIILETIAKLQKIITDIVLYIKMGLTGLGISFIISYIYYSLQNSLVCRYKYGIKFSGINYLLIFGYSAMSAILIWSFISFRFKTRIVLGCIIIIISSLFSYYQLNKIIDITGFIRKRILKTRHKNE
jgi:O-antigen/teichoic acid export membrane protein